MRENEWYETKVSEWYKKKEKVKEKEKVKDTNVRRIRMIMLHGIKQELNVVVKIQDSE